MIQWEPILNLKIEIITWYASNEITWDDQKPTQEMDKIITLVCWNE